MISNHKLIVVIATLSYLVFFVEGFPLWAIPSRTVRCSRNHVDGSNGENVVFLDSPPLAARSNNIARLDGEHDSENWTMEEDWVLLDNLPLFTVSSKTETKTFWTQLWSANAIHFSTKQPEDLYRRVLELEGERSLTLKRQETKLQNVQKNRDQQSQSLTFGASPPVLENWKIDLNANNNRVVGQVVTKGVIGRRTIWFDYHVIGRLEGDPFADTFSSDVSLFPGGYIEAAGGRVYELGQPISLHECGKEETNNLSNKLEKTNVDPGRGNDELPTISRWWLPGSTATISALVSSTILSACIGYGAGLSMIQDGTYHHQTTSQSSRMPTVETVLTSPSQNGIKMPPQLSSSKVAAAATKSSTISNNSYPDQKPSIEEIRTRTQYKILREERLLKNISQRLELDKQNLKQLEEQQQ